MISICLWIKLGSCHLMLKKCLYTHEHLYLGWLIIMMCEKNAIDKGIINSLFIWPTKSSKLVAPNFFLMYSRGECFVLTSTCWLQGKNWHSDNQPPSEAYEIYASLDCIFVIIWTTYCCIKIYLTNYWTRWCWYIFPKARLTSEYNKMARQNKSVKTPF